jgi:repressor LexA
MLATLERDNLDDKIRVPARQKVYFALCDTFATLAPMGTIAAHSLVETFSDAEVEYVDLSSLLLSQRQSRHEISQYFVLRVRGDSMIGAAIDDGDLVVMKPPSDLKYIKDGAIVAARVGGKTTLKHYHRDGKTVPSSQLTLTIPPVKSTQLIYTFREFYLGSFEVSFDS